MRLPDSTSNKLTRNVLGWYKDSIATTISKVYNKLILKLENPSMIPLPQQFVNNHKEVVIIPKDISKLMISVG